jgi:predicted regulator of Ras-like GTPase activity (Roadblock/LC7/MglB family)
MILFLDDDSNRIKQFRSQVPSATFCRTAQEMISALSKAEGVIDWLFLDHDLGGEVFVDSSLPNTGMEVVRWLERNRKEIVTVVVHSHNPAAARLMTDRLRATGYNVVQVSSLHLRLETLFRSLRDPSLSRNIAGTICENLRQGVGLIILTGESGSDKSYVLQLVSKELEEADIRAILFWDPNLTFVEMLEWTVLVFEGISLSGSTHEKDGQPDAAADAFRTYLMDTVRDGKTVAFLVDDAQNAPLDTLTTLLSLSQEKIDGRHLLQVVLTGLPELEALLDAAPLRDLKGDSPVFLRLPSAPGALGGHGIMGAGTVGDAVLEFPFARSISNEGPEAVEREGHTPGSEGSTDAGDEQGPTVTAPGPDVAGAAKRGQKVLARVLGKITSACSFKRAADTRDAGEAATESNVGDAEKDADKRSAEISADLRGQIDPDRAPQRAIEPSRAIELSIDKEESMNRTENLLKVLKTLQSGSPDLEAAALISEDGLMMESALPQGLDETRVAAMSAAILNLGTRAAVELGRGSVEEVVVRGDHGYAVMVSAGRGVLLLVLANENAKLGLIFFDMREAIKTIRQIL